MSGRGFGAFENAIRMRDVVYTHVRRELERVRPRYQYGVVVSIDRANRICVVNYPPDTENQTVRMGHVQPARIGQTVRVDGLVGDRFVSDVLGDSAAPMGRVAYFETNSINDSTVSGAEKVVTGFQCTGSLISGRLYRVGAYARMGCTVAAPTVSSNSIRMIAGSGPILVASTALCVYDGRYETTSGLGQMTHHWSQEYLHTGANGTYTFGLTIRRSAGSGEVSFGPGNGWAWIEVLDLGAYP